MNILIHSRAQLGIELGYLNAEGELSNYAIANLLRAPLSRWGLSPKQAVLEHARKNLRACGIDDPNTVNHILQRLVDIGECEEVYVGDDKYLAPANPQWVLVGDGVGAFLGVSQPPVGITVKDEGHHDIIRRIQVDTDESSALLEAAGVQKLSLQEWLSPLGYLGHASRRMGQPARSDQLTLEGFWQLLEEELINDGLMFGREAEIRVLHGAPGKFFGRYNSPQIEGRWTMDLPEGIWCAYRRGFNESHWHPCIISVNSDELRVLDLYNADEWEWALLARGRHFGIEEEVRRNDGNVKLTFSAPSQLRAAMNILGRKGGGWQWNVYTNGPNLWELI